MGRRKPTQNESVFLISSVWSINRPHLILNANHHLHSELSDASKIVQVHLLGYWCDERIRKHMGIDLVIIR